jgi:type VI secretion system protein ImpI/type VI secretion system protein
MLAAQKRARAFDLFETRYGEIAAALADDFDSVFGRAFARAYEAALRDAESREA